MVGQMPVLVLLLMDMIIVHLQVLYLHMEAHLGLEVLARPLLLLTLTEMLATQLVSVQFGVELFAIHKM